jgi:AbrB family looped-hinge helix DNA binding protein
MRSIHARVSEAGRLSLPAELRRAVGLERGGDVVVELAGREIRVRPLDEVIGHAQMLTRRLLADKPGTSVEDFLIERRREVEQEG